MRIFFILSILIAHSLFGQNIIIPDINGATQTYLPGISTGYPPADINSNPFNNNNNFPKEGLNILANNFPKGGVIYLNMDEDADKEIIFHSVNKVFCVNIDGTSVPGWPVTIDSNEVIEWVPSSGDISGNGIEDIVFTSKKQNSGKVYAYDKSGNILPGFPIATEENIFTATLSDLDNDNVYEILTGSNSSNTTSELNAFKGNGASLSGFPILFNEKIAGNISAGDINNNSQTDIIVLTESKIWGFNSFGNILAGFPYTLTGNNEIFSYSSPILVDLDNDFNHEILVCSHEDNNGKIYVFKNDATILNGWPQTTANWIYASPIVADNNNDGNFEITVGDFNQSDNPDSYLYSYDINGNLLNSLGSLYGITSVTVADINSDGKHDFLVDANNQVGLEGKYFGINSDFSLLEGWPINSLGNTVFSPIVIGDLTNNATINILSLNSEFTSNTSFVNVLESNVGYSNQSIVNHFYQINEQHNGYIIKKNTTEISNNNKLDNKIELYPNPTKDILNIKSDSDIKGIEIYAINGQQILSKENKLIKSINVSNIEPGVYFIIINTFENRVNLKFIKN